MQQYRSFVVGFFDIFFILKTLGENVNKRVLILIYNNSLQFIFYFKQKTF